MKVQGLHHITMVGERLRLAEQHEKQHERLPAQLEQELTPVVDPRAAARGAVS